MNIVIWAIIAVTTAYIAHKLKVTKGSRLDLKFLIANSMIWTFVVATLSHVALRLGNLFEFSLISAHLAWSGSLLGIYMIQRGTVIKLDRKRLMRLRLGGLVNKGYQRLSNALSV